jgi:hypothetical protein
MTMSKVVQTFFLSTALSSEACTSKETGRADSGFQADTSVDASVEDCLLSIQQSVSGLDEALNGFDIESTAHTVKIGIHYGQLPFGGTVTLPEKTLNMIEPSVEESLKYGKIHQLPFENSSVEVTVSAFLKDGTECASVDIEMDEVSLPEFAKDRMGMIDQRVVHHDEMLTPQIGMTTRILYSTPYRGNDNEGENLSNAWITFGPGGEVLSAVQILDILGENGEPALESEHTMDSYQMKDGTILLASESSPDLVEEIGIHHVDPTKGTSTRLHELSGFYHNAFTASEEAFSNSDGSVTDLQIYGIESEISESGEMQGEAFRVDFQQMPNSGAYLAQNNEVASPLENCILAPREDARVYMNSISTGENGVLGMTIYDDFSQDSNLFSIVATFDPKTEELRIYTNPGVSTDQIRGEDCPSNTMVWILPDESLYFPHDAVRGVDQEGNPVLAIHNHNSASTPSHKKEENPSVSLYRLDSQGNIIGNEAYCSFEITPPDGYGIVDLEVSDRRYGGLDQISPDRWAVFSSNISQMNIFNGDCEALSTHYSSNPYDGVDVRWGRMSEYGEYDPQKE